MMLNHNLMKLISEDVIQYRINNEIDKYWLFFYIDIEGDKHYKPIIVKANDEDNAWLTLVKNDAFLLNIIENEKVDSNDIHYKVSLAKFCYHVIKLTEIQTFE